MPDWQQAWGLDTKNAVHGPHQSYFVHEAKQQRTIADDPPWKSDLHYFKKIHISALALTKMALHARSGDDIEVMGLMQGKVDGGTIIVTDTFRLPVEGTETRVNAADEANEYLIQYLDLCRQNKHLENPVGWYHSHPGYGCWLSGIDVSTQQLQQSYQDPFVALVIDPERTLESGKVDIGAFRTISGSHSSMPKRIRNLSRVPENKAQDFGAHADRYYSIDIDVFKSCEDWKLLSILWSNYWVANFGKTSQIAHSMATCAQISHVADDIDNFRYQGGQNPRTTAANSQMSNVRQPKLVDVMQRNHRLVQELRINDSLRKTKSEAFVRAQRDL